MEQPLLDAGMPPEGSTIYDSRKRAADTPEGAARKFVLWARAVGATGAYSARTISALYWECAEVDHREPVAIDRFLRALKTARGVRQETSPADRRRHVWIIDAAEPKPIPKARAADAKVAAKVPEVQPKHPAALCSRAGLRLAAAPARHRARRTPPGAGPQAARFPQRALGGVGATRLSWRRPRDWQCAARRRRR